MVNLRGTLEGHLILWAKNHYPGRSFDTVLSALTYSSRRHGIQRKTTLLAQALVKSGKLDDVKMECFIDMVFYHGAISSGKVSSYHLSENDMMKTDTLFKAIKDSISAISVMDHYGKIDLVLPEKMPDKALDMAEERLKENER